ncbi:kynureninase [Sesbania bispinosa]|nr:kynureninase [Sesbania bispinosa]
MGAHWLQPQFMIASPPKELCKSSNCKCDGDLSHEIADRSKQLHFWSLDVTVCDLPPLDEDR